MVGLGRTWVLQTGVWLPMLPAWHGHQHGNMHHDVPPFHTPVPLPARKSFIEDYGYGYLHTLGLAGCAPQQVSSAPLQLSVESRHLSHNCPLTTREMQPSLTMLSLPFVSSSHCFSLPSTIPHAVFRGFPHPAQSASSQATVYLRAWSFVCSSSTRHKGQQTAQRNRATAPAASSTPEREWKHHSLRRSQQRPQQRETSLALTLSSPWAGGNSRLSLARSILHHPSIRENTKIDQKGKARSPCLQLCVTQCPVAANSFLPPPRGTSPVWQQWVAIDSPGQEKGGLGPNLLTCCSQAKQLSLPVSPTPTF